MMLLRVVHLRHYIATCGLYYDTFPLTVPFTTWFYYVWFILHYIATFVSFYDPLSISDCNVDCRMTIMC